MDRLNDEVMKIVKELALDMAKEINYQRYKKTYDKYKDNYLKHQREYYQSNKDKISKRQKSYYEENKELISVKKKEYYMRKKAEMKSREPKRGINELVIFGEPMTI